MSRERAMKVWSSPATRALALAPALTFLASGVVAQPPPCFETLPPEPACCFVATPPAAACAPLAEECFGRDEPCFAVTAAWWGSTQEGIAPQPGVHLRWNFSLVPSPPGPPPMGLVFPRGGFEVQRRVHQQTGPPGPWLVIGPRIYPATTVAEATLRIPTTVPAADRAEYLADTDCDGNPDLAHLIRLLKRALCEGRAYDHFWWIEGSKDMSGLPRYWEDPLPTEFDPEYPEYAGHRASFVEEHGRWPIQYRFQPMEVIQLAAVDPVLARILGLYFADTTAAAGERYDYRVIAHYEEIGHQYCAMVTDMGSHRASAVPSPAPLTATARALSAGAPAGCASGMAVDLTWRHHLRELLPGPGSELEEADGNPPLRYAIYRKDNTPTTPYARLARPFQHPDCESPAALRVPFLFIGGTPDPLGGADPVWKDPPFYTDATVEAEKAYLYQVRGVDIFGRFSAAAALAGAIQVDDQVPPPAPMVIEARVFQKQDAALERLPAGERAAIAAVPGTDIVLRTRWLWLPEHRAAVCDLEEFWVAFGPPGDFGASRVVKTVLESGAAGCAALPGGDRVDCVAYLGAKAELFEAHAGLADTLEPVSDTDPAEGKVHIYMAGVRAVDEAANASYTTGPPEDPAGLFQPFTVAIRDFTAPPAPAAPSRPADPLAEDGFRAPGPPDPEGRATIALEWPAVENLTYLLHRASEAAPDRYAGVAATPLGPFGATGSFTDRVPGLEAERYRYLLQAIDPAGNRSPFSAASAWILVRDGFAPAKPAIARAIANPEVEGVAMPGSVRLEWLPIPEVDDVRFYRLYRTDVPARLASKRKMDLVWMADLEDAADETFNEDRGRFEVIDRPPRPENVQHYRLEAEDTSGNISLLSEPAAIRTADRLAPAAPAWDLAPRFTCPGGEPEIFVEWRAPEGAAESRLLRRAGDGAFSDLSGWLSAPGPHRYPTAGDSVDPETRYVYRLEARDGSGNTSRLDTGVAPAPDICDPRRFARGDPNCDGRADISDAIHVLGVLFLGEEPAARCLAAAGAAGRGAGGPLFPCADAADMNNDLAINISDPIFLLTGLFAGGRLPPPPFPGCGPPHPERTLGCFAHPCGR